MFATTQIQYVLHFTKFVCIWKALYTPFKIMKYVGELKIAIGRLEGKKSLNRE